MNSPTKRLNQYSELLSSIRTFFKKQKSLRTIPNCTIPKSRLGDAWSMKEVFERVHTANQLGFDTKLVAEADGLAFVFVERGEAPPYFWTF